MEVLFHLPPSQCCFRLGPDSGPKGETHTLLSSLAWELDFLVGCHASKCSCCSRKGQSLTKCGQHISQDGLGWVRGFPHIWDGKQHLFGVGAQGQMAHMQSQTEEEIKERLESPSSFLCCIFGRDRQGWPVTFQSVCSLSCPEIPDKRNHGMRSEELGSHPQDIPPTLTLFQARSLPAICQGLAVLTALASDM